MDKIAHGEGLWEALHDRMTVDSNRSILVMDSESYRLLRLYRGLMKSGRIQNEDVDEGWHHFNNWHVRVRNDVNSIYRVKY
jgi:hypothetical protein